MEIAAKPCSRVLIRKITENLRENLGMKNMLYFPIVPLIELLAQDETVDFDMELVTPQELADMYGRTNTARNRMTIREDVYEGAIKGNPRDRFTLCHELGHWILHQPENIELARGEIPKYCDAEWQANTFAGELMAPCYLIGNMEIEDIMEKCGVSYSCAKIQKEHC